jgi:hypothetical protein
MKIFIVACLLISLITGCAKRQTLNHLIKQQPDTTHWVG